jgi:Uma2 family endonuclease
MSIATARIRGEEADLETRPPDPHMAADDALYEVVHGVRVELPNLSRYAVRVASELIFHLATHAKAYALGEVISEGLFHLPLPEDLDHFRRPDIAYVSRERWPAERPDDPDVSAWDCPPDLAIEVVSPSDRADELMTKTLDYFHAGVRQVWLVWPRQALIHAYEGPKTVRVYSGDDVLEGAEVLPGFRLVASSIFGPIIS